MQLLHYVKWVFIFINQCICLLIELLHLLSVYSFIYLKFVYLFICNILRQLQSSVHESAEEAGEKEICNNE